MESCKIKETNCGLTYKIKTESSKTLVNIAHNLYAENPAATVNPVSIFTSMYK